MTFMPGLLSLARIATDAGEVPIAAAIVDGKGNLLAEAHNLVEIMHDATAHAEMIVLRTAMQARGEKYLEDCTLYVTLEPCAMCAQAASLAKIKKIIFGAYDPKGGGVEHGGRIFQQSTCHHVPEIIGGVMEEDCKKLLTEFFQAKR